MAFLPGLLALLVSPACRRPPDPPPRSTCMPCVADLDCGSERCAQLRDDAVCARSCRSDADCAADDRCVALVTTEGASLSTCLARDGACGAPPDPGSDTPDAGDPCAGTSDCTDALHAGGPVQAQVTNAGGTMDRLHFAVIGDTRPAVLNDTNHYPLEAISRIYQDLAALSPRPAFAVATGDYVFASPDSNAAGPQLRLYLLAREKFPGPLFPAYGNHECNGYTVSNCGPGIGLGRTSNYDAFIAQMMTPLGESRPYYARRIDAKDGSWTAKFVVVAPNSWDDAQGAWLETQLSQPTTYTFVVRHEPTGSASDGVQPAPGLLPSEAIVQKHPLTLELEGHAHTWMRPAQREVIVGNGGAPLSGGAEVGYTLVSQRADGAIVVTNYAADGNRPLATFAVQADGTNAP